MARDSSVSAGTSVIALVAVDDRLAVDKAPEIGAEARALLHHLEPGARRGDRAFDLRPIAHDALVPHQGFDLLAREARDLLRGEAVEGAAEGFPFPEDGDPGKPRLEPVEHELLVKCPVVALGHAPFLIVIGDIERIGARPRAALELRLAHALSAVTGTAKRANSGWRSVIDNLSGLERAALRQRLLGAVEPDRAQAPRRRLDRAERLRSRTPPASTGVPEGGSCASPSTGTMRFRASPRCSMRDTSSWPT